MKKYLFSIVVMAVFAIGFAASDDEEVAEKLVGNYVVVDSKGTTWYFTFTTEHKSVTVKSKGMSDDDMYYGDWCPQNIDSWLCSLNFISFHAGNPPIEFPNGSVAPSGETIEISDDGWIYNGSDNLKAKNPKARLKMTKQ
ncbi:MAG: hypothetical protein IJV19_04570 [Prevotella sp.]|nr:hypothetical protein [Prevotella sp.]